jgi:release factor glutamine methyltransferase
MAASSPRIWTIVEILRWTTEYFQEKEISEPRPAAEVLLAYVLGLSRLDLYLHYDQPLTPEELARFKALIVRRRQGEPVAYLTGHKEFWSLDFLVKPGVLIPRPETEILVQAALESAKDFLKTERKTENGKRKTVFLGVEIGVGSGAVVVSLSKELPHFVWLALDLSAEALAVSTENARRHGVAEHIHFVRGDLVSMLRSGPRFALMVANLPYVPRRVWERLPQDIKGFEPPEAFLGGDDGLDLIRRLTRQAHQYLRPGGCLALEVGAGQAEKVRDLLLETGAYEHLEMFRDYQGIQRVVRGMRR